MTYLEKYLKYKDKYLKLKKILTGGVLNLFFPSELIYNTQKLFIAKSVGEKYNKLFETILGDKFLDIYCKIDQRITYVQDTTIIFTSNKSLYIIQLSQSNIFKDILEMENITVNIDYKTIEASAFGGNFICTPPNTNIQDDLGVIISFKNFIEKNHDSIKNLKTFIRENIIPHQKYIELACSFTHNDGSIHSDELICSMPYKPYQLFPEYSLNYKIWIYSIRNIKIAGFINIKLHKIIENNPLKSTTGSVTEFIATHGIDKLINLYFDMIDKRKNDNDSNPKLKDLLSYKDYFNYMMNPYLKTLYDELSDQPEFIKKLRIIFNEELKNNKRIIGENIFGKQIYDDHFDEINGNFFVDCPIDITLSDILISPDSYYNFKIDNPPIFNRVYMETESKSICIIPIKTSEPSQEIKDFISKQAENISSIKYSRPVDFFYINTSEYHCETNGCIGGNIHCLTKQILSLN